MYLVAPSIDDLQDRSYDTIDTTFGERPIMAKLSRNAFIEKHKNGTLVGFDFADFRLRKKPSAAKKKPAKPHKPQYKLLRVAESSTGKILPTPSQIITALAKTRLGPLCEASSDRSSTIASQAIVARCCGRISDYTIVQRYTRERISYGSESHIGFAGPPP
jgi:hypothetical protein